jgi:hypothetical protein
MPISGSRNGVLRLGIAVPLGSSDSKGIATSGPSDQVLSPDSQGGNLL